MVAHVTAIYKIRMQEINNFCFFLFFHLDNEENVDEPNLEITTVSSHFD